MNDSSSIYGFVYVWYDRKRKMFYIGSHVGQVDDGYVCSSNRMRNAYRRRPHDFKRRIVYKQITSDRDLLLQEEKRWLDMITDLELKTKYYNACRNAWGQTSEEISLHFKDHWKDPEARAKHVEGMSRSWTPERKRKHGEIIRAKGNAHLKGRKTRGPLSEEERKAASERNRNRVYTNAQKQKMSLSAQRRANAPEHKECFRKLMDGRPAHNKIHIPEDFLTWHQNIQPRLIDIQERYGVSETVVLRWKRELGLILPK